MKQLSRLSGELFVAGMEEDGELVKALLDEWRYNLNGKDYRSVKWRCLELASLVASRAVAAGADPDEIEPICDETYGSLFHGPEGEEDLRTLRFHVASLCECVGGRRERKRKDLTEQAMAYIVKHCEGRLTLEDVARQVYVSPATLSQTLRSEIGMGFKEYHTLARISRAKDMLLENRSTVTEIAETLGFTDGSHFCRAFRKVEGETPTSFREDAQLVAQVASG